MTCQLVNSHWYLRDARCLLFQGEAVKYEKGYLTLKMVALHLSETLVNIHNSPEHLNFQSKISSPISQMTIFWASWNQSMHFFTTYQTMIYIQDCFSQPPQSLQVPELSQKLKSRTTLLMHMLQPHQCRTNTCYGQSQPDLKLQNYSCTILRCIKLLFLHANYVSHWSLFVI
jgi:hypothetical protein